MKLTVTLSANAGICLQAEGLKLWVDALHDEKVPGFSTVSPELFGKIMASEEFSNPDAVCVTHRHPDHYSEDMVIQALSRYPSARLLMPDASFGDRHSLKIGKENITFLRLTHEGEQYADCLHYGILLTISGKKILIPGDCRLLDPALKETVRGEKIDLALLNFPWLTLKKAEAFVREEICPRQVILYHLPSAEDDINQFRPAAERSAEKWGDNAYLLMNPLETIVLDI